MEEKTEFPRQKIKEFITIKPALQEPFKETLSDWKGKAISRNKKSRNHKGNTIKYIYTMILMARDSQKDVKLIPYT